MKKIERRKKERKRRGKKESGPEVDTELEGGIERDGRQPVSGRRRGGGRGRRRMMVRVRVSVA
jgi:hypothetical protein